MWEAHFFVTSYCFLSKYLQWRNTDAEDEAKKSPIIQMGLLERPTGLEPATLGLEGRCSTN